MTRSEAGKIGGSIGGSIIREQAIRAYYNNPNYCIECGSIIHLNGQKPSLVKQKKFCSHSCSAKCNNHKIIRPKKKHLCKYCGAVIEIKGRRYCNACSQDKSYLRLFDKLKGVSSIRARLIKERGPVCEKCGNVSWLGNAIPLEIHHKDGNYRNNDKGNLELLCPNCHALSDNYKGKNKGNGRDYRRFKDGNKGTSKGEITIPSEGSKE